MQNVHKFLGSNKNVTKKKKSKFSFKIYINANSKNVSEMNKTKCKDCKYYLKYFEC